MHWSQPASIRANKSANCIRPPVYADPSNIRDIVLRVRLSEAEDDLLNAVVRYTGQQKSTLMRELFIEQARLVLAGFADIGENGQLFEEPQKATAVPR